MGERGLSDGTLSKLLEMAEPLFAKVPPHIRFVVVAAAKGIIVEIDKEWSKMKSDLKDARSRIEKLEQERNK